MEVVRVGLGDEMEVGGILGENGGMVGEDQVEGKRRMEYWIEL